MIPHIPPPRHNVNNSTKPFNDLVNYIKTENANKNILSVSSLFNDIIAYSIAPVDKLSQEDKCVAIQIANISVLEVAAIEMNAVAAMNTRCKDPVFTFILSWPEHERPAHSSIFDAAEHALLALGLEDHQSIIAIHADTDNVHCHVAVNRVHPETYRSKHLEWSIKTLHLAARESEIKHGWSNDNGIYIAETNGHGNKVIVKSTKVRQDSLPTWHDPDSMETWLKTSVSKALKAALINMHSWDNLHLWLNQNGISLADTGGGGMRLHVKSFDSGEILSIPTSKGLRVLKRTDLESRWGVFEAAISSKVIRHDEPPLARPSALIDLSGRYEKYQQLVRDGEATYKRNIAQFKKTYSDTLKENKLEEKLAYSVNGKNIKLASLELFLANASLFEKHAINKKIAENTLKENLLLIERPKQPTLSWREWLHAQANLGDQSALSSLRSIVYQAHRDPIKARPSLPSQEASKLPNNKHLAESEPEAYNTFQFSQLMAQLIEGEKKENAIRAARIGSMRPYQSNSLLKKYVGMQWRVTGNGNVEYNALSGRHLFTDSGSRITFDKTLVTDDEIRLALIHASHKFGNKLTLTGDDSIFTARMACIADEMSLIVLNPDMQSIIADARTDRLLAATMVKVESSVETPELKAVGFEAIEDNKEKVFNLSVGSVLLVEGDALSSEDTKADNLFTLYEHLKQGVLAINPQAEFIIPDININNNFEGKIIHSIEASKNQPAGFAQHLGRWKYALHSHPAPTDHMEQSIKVSYKDGIAINDSPHISKKNDISR